MNSAISTKKFRYSVVIVTYNSRENISVCLDSLRSCALTGKANEVEGGLEIIVVDNNSKDGTKNYLASRPDIHAILNDTNNGFSKGCNQGADVATGEFLIFLNPDTLVTPGWADDMARYFQDSSVGAVGPVSNYVAGLQRLDINLPPKWKNATQFPGKGAIEVAGNLAGILKEANSGKGIITKILIGFCLMMQRSLYTAMGGMDEKLFLGNDDLDLSWRLRNAGRKLVVASDAFVFHEGQKSFKTEAKSHVDRLTQESTDALYVKLVDHYGGADKVPSAVELWGMDWFSPSPALIAELKSKPRKQEPPVNTDSKKRVVWKGISSLVFLEASNKTPEASSAQEKLNRSLSTMPSQPSPDILVLNCSGQTVVVDSTNGSILRKLDLGASCTPKQSLEIAVNLLPGSHVLFCMAGVQFSTVFNHWLEKLDLANSGTGFSLNIRIQQSESGDASSVFAFLCRKDWLRITLSNLSEGLMTEEFLIEMNKKINEVAKSDKAPKVNDAPWLLANASDLPEGKRTKSISFEKPAEQSWTPVNVKSGLGMDEATIALYPLSVHAALRSAKNPGFAGSIAEMPALRGGYKVFDAKGVKVPLNDQDLIIMRVTPELIDNLDERLRNLKRIDSHLKKLVLVFDGGQARGTKVSQKNLLTPIDLTTDGIRAALRLAGFTVTNTQPYVGFPAATPGTDKKVGWNQVECIPRPIEHDIEKMVSIVILGFNQVEYTKKCIESIRKYTRQKYELIVVDNGSKDGTEAYFKSIPGARVIINPTNLGVAKGWNQGMRLATGDYILILNNDIIVGQDWLENMVSLAESDSTIGLVGPRSNYIAGPQVVANVPYKVEGEIQGFIQKWQTENDLSASEFGFIKGFCHLIPKRVFEKVGFYDERFGKGNFEDDDYCMRVHYSGFRAVMANDSFIHHYGSVSFNQESVDWQALMIENQKKYTEKWAKGPSAVNDTQVENPTLPKHEAKAPPTDATRALEAGKLAYSNGEAQKAAALFLESQAKDPKNPEVYTCLGVIQFHIGKSEDAIALFLQCLELEASNEDAAHNLIDCVTSNNETVTEAEAAYLQARYPSNKVFAALNSPAHAWSGSAEIETEEKILPAWQSDVEKHIEARNYSAAMDSLELKIRKNEDLGSCFNYLGIIAHACGDAQVALQHFTTAATHSPSEPDIVYNLVDIKITLGRPLEAIAILRKCGDGNEKGNTDSGVDFNASAEQIAALMAAGNFNSEAFIASRDENQKGEALIRSERTTEAKAIFTTLLQGNPKDFRALNNLGLVSWYEGHGDLALKNFLACLAIRPIWLDAVINAFDTALALGRIEEMHPYLERAQAMTSPYRDEFMAMSAHIQANGPAIYTTTGFEELQASAQMMKNAEKAYRDSKMGDAINIYLEAIKLRPKHPQAMNGLGIIAFAEKRFEDAYGLFEAAASMHPMDQDILMNLWECAQSLRRERDVLPKLKLSLERNPAFEEVKAAIREYA